jgi:predicted DNA-binding transcriptional regulator AlpA
MKVNKTEHIKKALIEALEKSLGIVTTACKQVGIGRTTFYDYLKKDEEFAKQVKDIENIALDFAESQLHKQIQEGNTSATIFYLKTKGKGRNYVERQEIIHNGSVESTIIEWKPPKEKSTKDATDNSTI